MTEWSVGCATVWGLRLLHLADLHLFSPVSIPFRWACWAAASSTAELRDRGGLPHVRAHGLGGDVFPPVGGTWAHKSEVVRGTLGSEYAQLSSLSSWRSRRKGMLVSLQTLSFFMRAQEWSKPGTWPKQRPFKESSKSCGSYWSSESDSNTYRFPSPKGPGRTSLDPEWDILILRRWGPLLNRVKTYMKMVDLRATMHWVGLILWCLLTLILGHVRSSSIKLYIQLD